MVAGSDSVGGRNSSLKSIFAQEMLKLEEWTFGLNTMECNVKAWIMNLWFKYNGMQCFACFHFILKGKMRGKIVRR